MWDVLINKIVDINTKISFTLFVLIIYGCKSYNYINILLSIYYAEPITDATITLVP